MSFFECFFFFFSFCISSLLMGIGKSFIQLFEKGGYNFAKIMCQICLALLHFDYFLVSYMWVSLVFSFSLLLLLPFYLWL
jgi:hypothetical protein